MNRRLITIYAKAQETAQSLMDLCWCNRAELRPELWLQPPLVCVFRCYLGTDLLKFCFRKRFLITLGSPKQDLLDNLKRLSWKP